MFSASGAGPMPITPFSAWKMTSRSCTKSETFVGMPMPRLTNQPSGMSRAMRAAMPSRSSGFMVGGSLHRNVQHALHEDSGGVDVFRLDGSEFNDVRSLHDGGFGSHGHDG